MPQNKKLFAIDALSSSSPIRFGIVVLCITGGRGRWFGINCGGMLGIGLVKLTIGCIIGTFFVFGVVLFILCRGLFICPLAIAGHALRYLWINFSLRLGHPSRKRRQTAFRSVEICGVLND